MTGSILAIDPGCTDSAYVVWDGERLLNFGKCSNEEMQRILRETLRSQTSHCAIEMIGNYGMAVGKSVFWTCIWIGRFGERYGWDRCAVILRPTVKTHICGTPRAKDGNVRQALIDRFGAPGTKKAQGATYGVKADIWQAFALAVTWWDKNATGTGFPA